MNKRAFQAYADGASVVADTPREAAVKFFSEFPRKRKCDIIEGESDGPFFTVRLCLSREGIRPYKAKGVTKSQIPLLEPSQ